MKGKIVECQVRSEPLGSGVPGDYAIYSREDAQRVEDFMNHMFENDPDSKAALKRTFERYLNGVIFGYLASCIACDRVYNSNNPGYSECVSCCAMKCEPG